MAGLLGSFAEAAERILPQLAALHLSESTVERVTEVAGQQLGQQLQAGEIFGEPMPWNFGRDADGQSVAQISVDATGVGIQGPGGSEADGRMVNLAMISNPLAEKDRDQKLRVLAGIGPVGELGEPMRRQAAQVGMEGVDVWLGLSDGGSGLEEWLQVHFPRCECILDFWHAAEHVHEFARVYCGGRAELSRQLGESWCGVLKEQGGQALLEALRGLEMTERSEAAKEEYRKLWGYVSNNVQRMDYPRYRKKGWPIGSGQVESGCKGVVGQRLKGQGMRWSVSGADGVCRLRALFKSEKGQWEAFWNTAA